MKSSPKEVHGCVKCPVGAYDHHFKYFASYACHMEAVIIRGIGWGGNMAKFSHRG